MKLCVITGEASGDMHAAAVIRQLRQLDPSFSAFGIGGAALAAEGVRLLHDVQDLAIVGLFNVIRHLPMYLRVYRETWQEIQRHRPDVVLLVDFPGFNLRLARRCKEAGLRVIFFISPQVWAWRQSRIEVIRNYVDHTLVIFPFEEEFYRRHGVPATYVGNPLIEQLHEFIARDRTDRTPHEPVRLALLPGSRRLEIAMLLRPMLEAVAILQRQRSVDAFIVKAPTIDREQLTSIVGQSGAEVPIIDSEGKRALAEADIAVSSSGTATLEAAVLGVPVVVVYRLSRASYMVARRLVRLEFFSLVNIVAGKQVVPELLQEQVTPERIASAVTDILVPDHYRRVRRELMELRARLGDQGASRRAAEKILTLVGR